MQGENVSSRVPTEIWVKIFEMSPKSRNLSKLRLVCKQWQAVIDENFKMKVKINDDKMDVSSIINFKRVVHCIVSKFSGEDALLPTPTQLFWDSENLSTLNIRGTITKPNFLLIAQQCQNVKELILTGSVLNGDSSIFETGLNEETSVLSKFMSSLQKLVVNGLHIETSEDNPVPINLCSVLKLPMDELKTLVLRANFRKGVADQMFFGLLKNCHSLENIEFTLRGVSVFAQVTPIVFVLPTLTTLSIDFHNEDRMRDWLPFIGAQNSIKHLKLISPYGFELDQPIVNAIIKNAKSLQSLELRKLRKMDNNVCAQFSRELCKLSSLILHGYDHATFHNLRLLPDSLQVVVLENFKCDRQDLAIITERVVNLTTRNVVWNNDNIIGRRIFRR